MKIEIKKITLTNFKGIRSLSIPFSDVTNVFGNNATGKTTLMDAFLWLLFDKDSTGRETFEIKTVDENNQPYHRLDHEVEAVLLVDGSEIILRHTMNEIWRKPKGSITEEFSGHEKGYYWNGVPLKQKDYKAKIAELVDENLFKLLTNTTYFNSLKWQDRRAVLSQIAGRIDDMEILDSIQGSISDAHNELLLKAIKEKKHLNNFKEYRAELSATKKKLKDQLDLLPSRIAEANLALPEELDYTSIDEQIESVIHDIDNVDGLLNNKSKAARAHQDSISTKIKEAGELNQQLQKIEFAEAGKIKQSAFDRNQVLVNKKNDLRTKQFEKDQMLSEYNKDQEKIKRLTKEKEEATVKHVDVSKEQLKFNENEFHCPACKRAFDESVIDSKKDELTANFNKNKSDRLKLLVEQGTNLAEQISILTTKCENTIANGTKLKESIATLQSDISILEEENNRLMGEEQKQVESAVSANTEHAAIKEKIVLLTEEINTPHETDDNTALMMRKKQLQAQLDTLKSQLQTKGQREKQLSRIKELEQQEGTMAAELASLEGIEFSIDQFVKAAMTTLEDRVNGRFKIVRFKMFEDQINGGEVEACTTLINGVPYADANTAAKIQAGLDIINTLSDHYGVQAPVWVDNRESVIKLPETNCQLINLIVSEADKKLRIESAVLEAVA